MPFEIQYEVPCDPKPPQEGRWRVVTPLPRNPQEVGIAIEKLIEKLLAKDDFVLITIRKVKDE